MAGNKIYSFREVKNLNRLPKLIDLKLYDPHYGENPICNLCNYQTYVLHHLDNIQILDTLEMTEDAKRYAEATFMKKKMYYNMRIKTIKRTFSAIIQICKKATLIKKDLIN